MSDAKITASFILVAFETTKQTEKMQSTREKVLSILFIPQDKEVLWEESKEDDEKDLCILTSRNLSPPPSLTYEKKPIDSDLIARYY